MRSQVILVGAFHEMIELCGRCGVRVAGIYDNVQRGEYLGCEILGDDRAAGRASAALKRIPVVVVPDAPAVRKRLVAHYRALGFSFRSLVSPAAALLKSAVLGEGVVVQSACAVSSFARIGDFVRLNTGANVTHDVTIGDYATVGPDAVLLGRVSVGACCYIGANSTILPGKKLGVSAVVGAGAVVTKDVRPGVTVAGVPARRLVKS
jgi:sugar O-acyltransferase (sialic acid O-acetyltransferase NeuD family)